MTAIAVPEGLTDVQVRAHCRERYGVMISGGQGAGNLVRIGHMGPTARSLYPVVGAGRARPDAGRPRRPVEIGDGVEAALEVLSQTEAARVTLPPFELHRPRSGRGGDASCSAARRGRGAVRGGTELLLLLKLGFSAFGHLVDLKAIEELAGLRVENGDLGSAPRRGGRMC